MDALDRDYEIVEHALCELARAYSMPAKFRSLTAFDRIRGQFLLIDEGWDGNSRVHRLWIHVEILNGKILIHEDGTEEGVANLLVTAGIPRERIVLAFYAPSLRPATDFAVA